MDRKLAVTNYSVLERAKRKKDVMTALVLAIYTNRLLCVVMSIVSVVVMEMSLSVVGENSRDNNVCGARSSISAAVTTERKVK